MKIKILFILSICIIGGLLLSVNVLAQEDTNIEDEITAEDLEISEPTTLPNSPFYFLKNIWRQARLAFAFNPIKKAGLRLEFASEMLLEAKKLAEETNDQELFQRAIDKYQQQIEKIQNQVGKFKNKDRDDIKVDSFVNRFNRKVELHQQIMEKLREKLSDNPQALESVQKAKQRTIQHLNQVKEKLMERFQNRERKCKNLCGDNQCQEVVCQAIGCPCAETTSTCPQDCK